MQMAEVMQRMVTRMNEIESELRSSAAKTSELQNIVQQQQQLLQSQQTVKQQSSMVNETFAKAMDSIAKSMEKLSQKEPGDKNVAKLPVYKNDKAAFATWIQNFWRTT